MTSSPMRRVRIEYPVPLDVAGNLTKALGLMYPDATIRSDDPKSDTCLVLDLGSRTARVSKKRLTEELLEPVDADLVRMRDGTVGVSTPEEAKAGLAEWAAVLLMSQDAFNYVEQPVTDRETGRTFLVTACWSAGQSPHELRMVAEKRAEVAEARVAELEALLREDQS